MMPQKTHNTTREKTYRWPMMATASQPISIFLSARRPIVPGVKREPCWAVSNTSHSFVCVCVCIWPPYRGQCDATTSTGRSLETQEVQVTDLLPPPECPSYYLFSFSFIYYYFSMDAKIQHTHTHTRRQTHRRICTSFS